MPEAAKNARRVLDVAPEDAHLMLGGAASVLGLTAWAGGDLEAARRMTADGTERMYDRLGISLPPSAAPSSWRISRSRKAISTRQ